MTTGVDKNFVRLAIACAAFHKVYGQWPIEARVAPYVIWDYGHLFDLENFTQLCERLRLRTTKHAALAVGDATHHIVYQAMDSGPTQDEVFEAVAWLGVRMRPEMENLD